MWNEQSDAYKNVTMGKLLLLYLIVVCYRLDTLLMMIVTDIILLLLIFIVSTESAMHWAVKIDEGVETAKKIAQENGFNFIGQVN